MGQIVPFPTRHEVAVDTEVQKHSQLLTVSSNCT